MKKLIIAAFAAVASLTANAQIWMGGALGYSTYEPENGKSQSVLTIAPTIGYTLNDDWDVAVSVNEKNYTNNSIENSFTIAPFARYTFARTGNVAFFVDGGFSFGSTSYKVGDDKSTFGIGINPGVKFSVSDNVCFVTKLAGLGYEKVSDSYSRYGFDVNNTGLQFGLYWGF